MKYLAPIDNEAGGTWLAVNANGVVVALLNGYAERFGRAPEQTRSRGLLVRDLAGRLNEAKLDMTPEELVPYEPFHLVLFELGAKRSYRWNGNNLDGPSTIDAPAVSSSWHPEDVRPHRRQLWNQWANGSPPSRRSQALAFHQFAPEGGDAFSPMHAANRCVHPQLLSHRGQQSFGEYGSRTRRAT